MIEAGGGMSFYCIYQYSPSSQALLSLSYVNSSVTFLQSLSCSVSSAPTIKKIKWSFFSFLLIFHHVTICWTSQQITDNVTIFKINQYSSKKFSIMTYTFSSWISKLSDWIETFIKLWEKRSKRTKNVIRGFINIVRCGVWAVLCSIDWLMSWVSPEHIFAPTLGPDLLSWPAATHSSHPSLSFWWSWELRYRDLLESSTTQTTTYHIWL